MKKQDNFDRLMASTCSYSTLNFTSALASTQWLFDSRHASCDSKLI